MQVADRTAVRITRRSSQHSRKDRRGSLVDFSLTDIKAALATGAYIF